MQKQSVTVIIPVYNIVSFLPQAIESVASQDHPEIEIIIVNDGSNAAATQKINRICSAYENITLINQKNTGQALARYNGIKQAKGNYIIFLDADDILTPGSVSHLVSALEENPAYIASYGTKVQVNEKGDMISPCPLPTPNQAITGDILPAMLQGAPLLSNGNICIRKEFIEQVSFPADMKQGEDWVTWCRLALLGNIIYAGDKIVLKIRAHGNNTSEKVFKKPSLLFKMLDEVYKDSNFVLRIGAQKLHDYRRRHRNHINAHFRYSYKARGQHLRAFKHKVLGFLWKA